jgi:hypothetical protein
MKKFLALALATVTILGSTCVYAADGEGTRYVFNGEETSVNTEAIIKNDVLFLPAEDVFKLSQNKVIVKTTNNSLTVEALGKPGYVSVWVGRTKGRENGENITVSIAPFKEDNVIYVPVKFVEEQMGAKISYDTDKNTIYIDSEGEGLITSTYKVPTVKSSSKGGSSSSASTGSTYKRCNYVPNFATVVGITDNTSLDVGLISFGFDQHESKRYPQYNSANQYVGMEYSYADVDSADEKVQQYINKLESLGFEKTGLYAGTYKKGGEYVRVSNDSIINGVTVQVLYASKYDALEAYKD